MFEVPVKCAEQELVEQEVLQGLLLPECVGRLVRLGGRRRFAVPSVLWPPLGDV